jgi:hypothetical protein
MEERLAQKGDRFEVLPNSLRMDGMETILVRHLGPKSGPRATLSHGAEFVVADPGGRVHSFSPGDEVKVRQDRDLAGFEGVVRRVGDGTTDRDGRSVHVELTGAARGTWRFRPEWLENLAR